MQKKLKKLSELMDEIERDIDILKADEIIHFNDDAAISLMKLMMEFAIFRINEIANKEKLEEHDILNIMKTYKRDFVDINKKYLDYEI